MTSAKTSINLEGKEVIFFQYTNVLSRNALFGMKKTQMLVKTVMIWLIKTVESLEKVFLDLEI